MEESPIYESDSFTPKYTDTHRHTPPFLHLDGGNSLPSEADKQFVEEDNARVR